MSRQSVTSSPRSAIMPPSAPHLAHRSVKMSTGPSESDLRRLQMERESSGVRRAVDEEVKRNVNRDFESLLDSLQVPAATRLKLEPLETPVKDALLRNSRLSNVSAEALANAAAGSSTSVQFLRKARSGMSLRPASNESTPGSTLDKKTPQRPVGPPPRLPSALASPASVESGPGGASRRTSGTRRPSASHPYAIAQAGRSRNVTPIRGDGSTAQGHIFDLHSQVAMTNEMLGLPLPAPAFAREGKTSTTYSSSSSSRPASPSRSSFGRSFFGRSSTKPPAASATGDGSLTSKQAKGSQPTSFDVRQDSTASSSSTKGGSSSSGGGGGKPSPDSWARFLTSQRAAYLDVGRTKTLRMLLRHESATWVERFLKAGGYEALQARLMDLIDAEWRDDLHDEQLFIELLRCLKALTTSEAGKHAIRSHSARPLRDLFKLLYSEKRPGDIATRQLIIELAQSMFEIYPERSGHRVPSSGKSGVQECDDIYAFVLSLLDSTANERALETETAIRGPSSSSRLSRPHSQIICPASELERPKLDVHDFVAAAHKPRIYKVYLTQLQEICRDFFWVMSHGENGIWSFADVDERRIRPQAPTGATGSVEYEAVDYLTAHFRLINAIARGLAERDADTRARQRQQGSQGGSKDESRAWRFHADLMASGMDRTLCTVRKASIEHYAAFHLEVARYVHLAAQATTHTHTHTSSTSSSGRSSVVPYVVERLVTLPPGHLRGHERELERAMREQRMAAAAADKGNGVGGFLQPIQRQAAGGGGHQHHHHQQQQRPYALKEPPAHHGQQTQQQQQQHLYSRHQQQQQQPPPTSSRAQQAHGPNVLGGDGGGVSQPHAYHHHQYLRSDPTTMSTSMSARGGREGGEAERGSLDWNFEFQY